MPRIPTTPHGWMARGSGPAKPDGWYTAAGSVAGGTGWLGAGGPRGRRWHADRGPDGWHRARGRMGGTRIGAGGLQGPAGTRIEAGGAIPADWQGLGGLQRGCHAQGSTLFAGMRAVGTSPTHSDSSATLSTPPPKQQRDVLLSSARRPWCFPFSNDLCWKPKNVLKTFSNARPASKGSNPMYLQPS